MITSLVLGMTENTCNMRSMGRSMGLYQNSNGDVSSENPIRYGTIMAT